jgi:hypothetical protein
LKTCSKCKKTKDLSEFYTDARDLERGGLGRTSYCKDCMKKANKLWYETSERYRELIREGGLKHRFGITSEDYWKMSEAQNHVCYICKERDSKYLHIDHDHTSGELRGLLCKRCNHGLGNFRDRQDLLKNAIEYLQDFSTV